MQNYIGVLPIGWLAFGGLLTLIGGTFPHLRRGIPILSLSVALFGALGSFYLAATYPHPRSSFLGMIWGGGLYSFISGFIAVVGMLALLFLWRHLQQNKDKDWEIFPLSLILMAALATLPASNHLLLSVVALETVSLGAYALVGLSWDNRYAPEAAVKYFLLGAIGFAFLLFGLSYLYGLTGSLYFHHLWAMKWEAWAEHPLFALGMGLIGIGLLFKLAVFPFHWWAPDAYGGATPAAAGWIVALGKLNGAFLAGILLHYILIPQQWLSALAGIAAVSSLYGNLLAIRQDNLQRMLGYSSVAHGGYLLLALVSGPEGRLQAWAYSLLYALTSVIAFGLLSLREEPLEYKSLRGLGYQEPGYAAALALSFASLSGMPPLVGFFAKYGVFVAGFRAGHFIAASVALIGALMGYFAYWRPISWLYQRGKALTLKMPILAIGAILLLLIGVLPLMVWGWMDYLYGIAGFFLARP
ncbi:MAG: NADH-quinone oxidoreductase subunit N [Bacteroidia bacterium]|nr:NADH-quinone oxidoreductase subunit N [Bacteroidia bacterium]MDW8134320.1 NADH-quinone oxidoreductase subunit N [Bacteroidia bacterium]